MKQGVSRLFWIGVAAVAVGAVLSVLPSCDKQAANLGRWAAEQDAR